MRSGSAAVEFALLMPVFVLLLGGLLEFSWLFFTRSGLNAAAREGCRAGVLVDPEEIPDPEQVATEATDEWLARYHIRCASEGARCIVSTEYIDKSPIESLRCTVTLDYRTLTGLVPAPETLKAVSEMRLERQR
ncbi:MAG: hypothetical protein ACI8RZ_007182 [Myxococcota bacterium]|jgi:hypothetical protein